MKIRNVCPLILTIVGCISLPAPAMVLTNNLSFALSFVRDGTTPDQKVEKIRVSNKEIIAVLGIATTHAFPPGSSLEMIATNSTNAPLVFVTGKGGLFLADVSRFFSFDFSTNKVQQSKLASSSAVVRTTYSIVQVAFDDGQGNSFDVSGAATGQYHSSPASAGVKETGSILLDAAGPGASGGRFSVAKGKIKFTGKDTVAAPR
jgi:hypothetical protein